ncbi:MAG: beta-propeller domain-containing protein, partial [Verrucomicrobiae bacterium]|nr:beta-propeller domain-containing protein [Verrucomicrobiae bacterium]
MKLHLKILPLLAGFLLLVPVTLPAGDEFEVVDSQLVDRAVVLRVPEGVRRIRLRIKSQDDSWETCTLAHLSGTQGFLKLRLPDGVEAEDIEVAASWSDPFPYDFYAGKSDFTPEEGDGGAGRLAPGDAEFTDAGRSNEETTVEESDIWKWRGDTLYFFNQYRGLQVIDVSDPAMPRRLASMRVPSSGEQMYLHPDADFVALLTYNASTGTGEVLLVEHTADNQLIKRSAIPVPGYILESRLVGNILYVVARNWWQESLVDPDSGIEHVSWKSGISVFKIDLSDPVNPVVSDPLDLQSDRYDYWGGEVQATPEVLMIATSSYDNVLRQSISTVHVVDISDPEKDPELTFQLPVKGQVLNKFNMHFSDNVLTVASQVWRWSENRRRYASVETFDLSQPSEGPVKPLGSLELANNETLTASRFSGDLLYLVTVLRVDPLFVISLADPANPQLLGELEVPGFSSHLEVLDDSLISVGVEGSQIAVSWFDVSNPAEPTLASRVYVGEEDGWSWTEANWDEKAFGFFPDDGWILLPYSGYDSEWGWSSGVQLIQMGEKELTKRGAIQHEFQARRARVLGDAVVSISGQSLKSLDITDPDNPLLLSELILAWPADYVHRVGDFLVQLERGPSYWWGGVDQVNGKLHVSPVADPDELVASIEIPGGRIAGSTLKDNCLIIAQENFIEPDEALGITNSTTRFVNTVIDLTDPATPVILGTDYLDTSNDGWYGYGSDYQGALLASGALLWYPAELNYYFYGEPRIGGGFTDALFPYYPSSV